MSLQKKVFVLFLTLGIVFSLGSYTGLTAVVQPTFDTFERQSAEQSLLRVRRALEAEFRSLEIVNREYSEWDHTYEYAQGRRADYVAENLDVAYWKNIDIDIMVFADADGNLLWGGMTDGESGNSQDLSQGLLQSFGPEHPLLAGETDASESGFLRTRGAPLMVSKLPILTTLGEGPAMGTLVVGKYLDEERVRDISRRAGTELRFITVDNLDSGIDMFESFRQAASSDDLMTWETTKGRIVAREALRDVFGQPAFLLEVGTPRAIAGIGRDAINLALVFFLVATVFFLLGAWIFMKAAIVEPVTTLTRKVVTMRESGDTELELKSDRRDEIGVLTNAFGELTASLGKANKGLESARDRALAVSNAKSEFLARMSHEIRTPMNGVLGMVELLDRTPLAKFQRQYTASIQDSAKALLDVIDDILDFSKVEAGKLQLDNVAFELNPFLHDVTESLRGLANDKRLMLSCITPEGGPLFIEADPIRLRQVLVNLLGNAIKFTEKGSVILQADAALRDDDQVDVTFEVIDTGIGIARDKQHRIFESFAQEDGSTTRRYGGTGLGLTICRQLVSLMGGNIQLSSRRGKGSRFFFTLTLPLRAKTDIPDSAFGLGPAGSKSPDLAASPGPLRGHVLVAEDNAVNQAVAIGMLEAMGVYTVVVNDGEAAVERAMSEPFDVILMDCRMPLLDGYDATRKIREFEAQSDRPAVPIIAVTANALPGDMEKCVSAGMDDYISKPFKIQQLYRSLTRFLPVADYQSDEQHRIDDVSANTEEGRGQHDGVIDESVLDELSRMPQSDNGLVLRVIRMYLGSSRELMARLGEALDNHDAGAIRETAHALKSSSANVGAMKLSALFGRIETSTRQNDEPQARELQVEIRREYERVVEALRVRVPPDAA
jgi:signal transduction histidine kinase/FixJ family two-component response regulator